MGNNCVQVQGNKFGNDQCGPSHRQRPGQTMGGATPVFRRTSEPPNLRTTEPPNHPTSTPFPIPIPIAAWQGGTTRRPVALATNIRCVRNSGLHAYDYMTAESPNILMSSLNEALQKLAPGGTAIAFPTEIDKLSTPLHWILVQKYNVYAI